MRHKDTAPLWTILLAVCFITCDAPGPQLTVQNARVRENIPPKKITAAYLVIQNSGPENALVAAQTDVAEVAELHVMIHDGDIMRMKKIDRIPIPANGTTTLQPGGNHLMLIGLTHDLKSGDKVAITLTFADGQTQTLHAPVEAPSGHDH